MCVHIQVVHFLFILCNVYFYAGISKYFTLMSPKWLNKVTILSILCYIVIIFLSEIFVKLFDYISVQFNIRIVYSLAI